MSRITDALARAQKSTAAKPVSLDSHVPWDLDESAKPPADAPLPWDLGARPAAEPAVPAQKPTARAETPPAPVLAQAAQRPIVPIRPRLSGYSDKLIIANHLPAGVVEQYRRLGAVLHQAQADDGTRVIMVASAMPAEGKTLVSSNLALVLSQSYGRRVLLMDGDLRRPSVHTVFGLENISGIADRLEGDRPGTLPPVQLSANLEVLVAGTPQADPLRIVTSPAMHRLIQDAASRYDWVVMDTPPVGMLPDAHLLAAMVDKVILVIEAGKTPYDVIQKSIEMIGKDRIIGTVLNRAEATVANPYDTRYDEYYGTSVSR